MDGRRTNRCVPTRATRVKGFVYCSVYSPLKPWMSTMGLGPDAVLDCLDPDRGGGSDVPVTCGDAFGSPDRPLDT